MKKNTITKKFKDAVPSLMTLSTIWATASLIACHSPSSRPVIVDDKSKDLIPIAEINNKRFAVKTLLPVSSEPTIAQKAAEAKVETKANAKTEEKKTEIAPLNVDNSLPVVEIETPATLLNNVPFRAQPNSSYEAMYRLEGNNINVYKLGAETQIDGEEAKVGIMLADSRLAVPLVSYPVKFIKLTRKQNADKELTKQTEEIQVDDESLATHVRVDMTAARLSSAVMKSRLVLAANLTGKWALKITMNHEGKNLGPADKEDLSNAEKVELKLTEEALNVNLAKDKSDKSEDFTIISIPVSMKDFEQPLAKNGKRTMLSGKMTTPKAWNQKRFAKLTIEKTKTVASNEYLAGSYLGEEAKIINSTITDNLISFDLEPQSAGGTPARFTLVRLPSEEPKKEEKKEDKR